MSLRKEPTEEERALADGVGFHAEEHVPFRMFAKVAMRADDHAAWIATMRVKRKWFRRRVPQAIVALIANLGLIGGYVVHVIRSAADDDAREVQQQRDIARLEQDVRDLRRICGLDYQGQAIVQLEP